MMSQFEPEVTVLERERNILEIIQNHPNLHHNALIKKMVPKYMAKATFEKTKNILIEKNILTVNQKGNKKFYHIAKKYFNRPLQIMERVSHENFQFLQHEMKKFNEEYNHKDINEKISKCVQLSQNLLYTDNGFTILDSIKNSKKTLYKDEHQVIQEMISIIFKSISKDKDVELIYPIVIKNIQQKYFYC